MLLGFLSESLNLLQTNSPQQTKVTTTRDKLILVARQLFVSKGLEDTTMNDIAEASDKGRRTIYTYFRNKKEIYNAVLEHESDEIVKVLKEVQSNQSLGPEEKLRRFLRLHLEKSRSLSSSESHIKSLFKFDLRRMERIRKLVFEKENAIFLDIIDEGVRQGCFSPGRCELLRSFLIRCLNSVAFAGLSMEPEPLKRIQGDFVDFIVSDITMPRGVKNDGN